MITETSIKHHIEKTDFFNSLSGTDKFKQSLILKRAKEIYHNYELAKRQGLEYVKQYVNVTDSKIIEELLKKLNIMKNKILGIIINIVFSMAGFIIALSATTIKVENMLPLAVILTAFYSVLITIEYNTRK